MESSVLERTSRTPATGLGENVPLCVSLSLSVSVALVLGVDSYSVAMVVQDVQKQTQPHCLSPPVTVFHA